MSNKVKEREADPHVSVTFSVPQSIKDAMDQRVRALRITRSDYLKFMVLYDLDKGPKGVFEFPRTPVVLEDRKVKGH